MNTFCNFGAYNQDFYNRLGNVLLNGIHKLEKDNQCKTVMYQTAIKKARLS
jgi:hypothetical protein